MKSGNGLYPEVIVLGLGTNGLGIIRSLSNIGIKIIGVSNSSTDLGVKSNILSKLVVNEDNDNEESLLKKLIKLSISCSSKPVLMFESDSLVKFGVKNKNILADHYKLNVYNEKLSSVFDNKYEMVLLAQSTGLSTPKSILISRIIDGPLPPINYPYIVKPITSKASRSFKLKGAIIQNENELHNFLKDYKHLSQDLFLQEYTSGPDSDVYQFHAYVDRDGKILASCTSRKIHQYKPGMGIGSLVINSPNPSISRVSVKFIRDIAYQGPVSLEFKYNSKNKCFDFIEINPRRTLHHLLLSKCGCNLSLTEYLDLVGQKQKSPFSIKKSKIYLWTKADSELKRCLYLPFNNSFKSVFTALRNILRTDVFPVYDFYDPAPFLLFLNLTFRRLLNKSNAF